MLGIVWGNMTPSTELPRDFCAGIGPPQLGVVLVFVLFYTMHNLAVNLDKLSKIEAILSWLKDGTIFVDLYQ